MSEDFRLFSRFDKVGEISIPKDEAQDYFSAKEVLAAVWEIEDAFTLVADSFISFERELFSIAIDWEYGRRFDQSTNHGLDSGNRRTNLSTVTFLTSAGIYIDHVLQRASSILDPVNEVAPAKVIFSRLWDDSIEYRVMQGLRNYAVHHALPIKRFTIGGRNLFAGQAVGDGPSKRRVTVSPGLNCESMCRSQKINAKTRRDIAELGVKYLDLKFFVRGYIAALARGHGEIRNLVAVKVEEALKVLDQASEKYERAFSHKAIGLSVCEVVDGQYGEPTLVDPSHYRIVEKMATAWRGLEHTQRAYISSEVTTNPDSYPVSNGSIWLEE